MKRDLAFEVVYPHPVERVWRALTDRAALAEWLMANDFEPRVGHRFQFRTRPSLSFDGIVRCEVVALEAPRHLAYTWQGGPLRRPTLVAFTLEPLPAGTRLRLEHTGYEGPAGLFISEILGRGWRGLLRRKLARVLARTVNLAAAS